MLLPCEDNCLRRIAQDRPSFRVARYENLPLDIERAITAVIEREVELIRRLDSLKRDLEVRYDFSPYAAFKSVDKYTEGAINQCNLTQFLRAQGYYATEREVLSIIRRMDTSCAAAVSYSDFADFMRGHGSAELASSYTPSSSCCANRASSAGRNGSSSPVKIDSPTKPRSSSCNRTSPLKKKSISTIERPCSPKKACCTACEIRCSPHSCIGACCRDCLCRPVPRICCECPCRLYHVCRPDSCLCRCRLYPCQHPSCSCICRPVCRPCGPALCSGKEYELVRALNDIIREERDLE